jgi:putative spermidine/putrescine transport system permease protein
MTRWLPILPMLVLLIVGLLIPVLYLIRMSFNLHTPDRVFVEALTTANYRRLIDEPFYATAIARTALLAAATALLTTLAAYGLAAHIWVSRGLSRRVWIGLALVPLLVSEIAVIIGWRLALPKTGVLPWLLSGGAPSPERIGMLYTWGAALVGTVTVALPYCVFVILGAFDGIDRRLIEASRDLGARPVAAFRTIVLPMTQGAAGVALMQAFVFTMAAYATPQALGPDTLWTIGFEVYRQMSTWRDWPFAAALATVLIALIAGTVWAFGGARAGVRRHD